MHMHKDICHAYNESNKLFMQKMLSFYASVNDQNFFFLYFLFIDLHVIKPIQVQITNVQQYYLSKE